MSWTDERVELLKKLWLDGLSASRIAAELAGGVTRNAVIGKVHRLGLSGREKTALPVAPARQSRPRPSTPARPPIAPQRSATMPPVRGNTALAMQPQAAPAALPQVLRETSDVVVPMCEQVTIMELRESMCRWPMGDPASSEFRYCGGKSTAGAGPYCNMHSRMAYQPTQDRRREQRRIA